MTGDGQMYEVGPLAREHLSEVLLVELKCSVQPGKPV